MKAEEAAELTMRNMDKKQLDKLLLKIRELATDGKTHMYIDGIDHAHKVWLINNGYWFGTHKIPHYEGTVMTEEIKHYITWFKLQV